MQSQYTSVLFSDKSSKNITIQVGNGIIAVADPAAG